MPRQISERTAKVREIVERIPPDKINGTTPTDLQDEFVSAGVAPRNERDKQTIYAEFSRRRRRLGLLRSQLHEQRDSRENERTISHPANQSYISRAVDVLTRISDTLKETDISLPELIDTISRLDNSQLQLIGTIDADDLMFLKEADRKLGRNSMMMFAGGYGLKEQNKGKRRA